MVTTAGKIIANDALPANMRDHSRVLTKGEVDKLLAQLAHDNPAAYREVSQKLSNAGRMAAYEEGVTIRLSDLRPLVDKRKAVATVKVAEHRIMTDKRLTAEEKEDARDDLYAKTYGELKDETMKAAIAANNPFALQVVSKARGNPDQLTALLTTPGTYQDAGGRTAPMFIGRSYAEGLMPHELWAATYGARTGIVSTKMGTRSGGYLGKLLDAASIGTVVTEEDCGTANGIPEPVDDKDNVGSVLARDVGPFKAGTVVTKEVISKLNAKGVKNFVLRSPIACAAHDGVCSRCTGIRESGDFPEVGYHLGINAASPVKEQVAQQSLNCLAAGTEVLMGDWSVKTIERIVTGDTVMGCGIDGVMRPVAVTNTFDNGVRDCVRTEFINNGTHHKGTRMSVVSTPDHKFLAARRVSSQKEACLNYVPRILPIGTKSLYFYGVPVSSYAGGGADEPLALLIGMLLGDGCYTEAVTGVHLSCSDLMQISDLEAVLNPMGIRITKLKGHDYYYLISSDLARNPVKSWLKKHGCWGKYAHEKRIPACVTAWGNKSVAELLAGLTVADGSVYSCEFGKPGISFASTSRSMLEDVRKLLMFRFGILTSEITKTGDIGDAITAIPGVDTYKRTHAQYQITITSQTAVKKFASVIPLVGVKRQRLVDLLAAYTPKISLYTSCNVQMFKRLSQIPVGQLPTYDIEVDHPDHLFVLANGLVCSNSKHTGKKHKGSTEYSGFEYIKDMVTVPSTFPGVVALAEEDGTVESVEPAPQGGTTVKIGTRDYHVAAGMPLSVKPGDKVEAGDALADGLVNPADAVRLRGVGEGRRYFADRYTKVLRDSGLRVNRRNIEAIARSAIDNVEVTEAGDGGELPGDIIRYNAWSRAYRPRQDAVRTALSSAAGKYLEEPALHYTIGTRVTRNVARELGEFGVKDVLTHAKPPAVAPIMESVVESPSHGSDWMARLGTSYLKTRLLDDVRKGSTSDVHSTNPGPGLAKGTEFGRYKGPGFAF